MDANVFCFINDPIMLITKSQKNALKYSPAKSRVYGINLTMNEEL